MEKTTNKLFMKTILENVDSKMVRLLHNAHKVTVYAAFVSTFFILVSLKSERLREKNPEPMIL